MEFYDQDIGLLYCDKLDAWFEVTDNERTAEQKVNAEIMYKQREEMDKLEEEEEDPNLWTGYNYGTADNQRYLTGKIVFCFSNMCRM